VSVPGRRTEKHDPIGTPKAQTESYAWVANLQKNRRNDAVAKTAEALLSKHDTQDDPAPHH
jgi:hypothetical protein